MKEATINKICDALAMAFYKAQVAASWFVILFGVGNALRCVFGHYDIFYIVCFSAIGYVGYKLMLRASLDELRKAREARKKAANE